MLTHLIYTHISSTNIYMSSEYNDHLEIVKKVVGKKMALHHHEDNFETSYSTPKLSLSKLPNKPRNYNNNSLVAPYTTPPLHPAVTIPFQWEEAPGKPKSPTTKSKAARCLDLPPRLTLLLNEEGKVTNIPSPTTVLTGPYVGRSLSCVNEGALEKKEEINGGTGSNNKDVVMMRSWRWENLKENNTRVVVKGNFDFSGPLSSSNSSANYDFDTHQRKFLRFTRKGSLLSFSRNNSNLLGGIYESFKQAVPWRWRRAKTKRDE
ncbi:hypothetical protein P3L10_009461 [Capsicum annuum]|uniref:uncharacterized protein LOC107866117 n=1 Tax=Capsicum annuum TaxID=4072 RepID=UPI001FB0A74E|nr:uncharacterized protein LOC107866117 [Capsicum annuum]